MKIDLIKLKFNDTYSYKYKPFQYCCDEIQNDKAIVFTGEDLIHSDDCWDEINVSDKYDELTKQRNELWKKCQRTDSKKKESELREQVRKLDNQIDSFYWLDEWKGEY